MGATKNMFMDLQCLIQHIENIEETKAYNDRRLRKSKAFPIKKSLNKYKSKQSKDVRNQDK